MGLLDTILGGVMGNAGGGGMQNALMGLLGGGQQQQGNQYGGGAAPGMQGGLPGLMSTFEQAGLGHLVQSWVGSGANQPVSPQQLQTAFGDDQVQGMANQAGMAPQDFLSQLSQHLPNAVNAMTPNGRVPDEGTMSV